MKPCRITAGVLALVAVQVLSAESKPDLSKEFADLQQKIQDIQPSDEAPDKDKLAFIEKMKTSYGDFAQKHPKTPEGYSAALTLASLLNRMHDKDTAKFAELAGNTAPERGVDPHSVALCWVWVATAKLENLDDKGARAAVEKIKPLDADMYEEIDVQVKDYSERVAIAKKAQEALQPGNAPFPIEEPDLKGAKFSLAALKGKVVVLEFWSTECTICMGEMPNMVSLYAKFHDKGLEIVGVNLDTDEDPVNACLKEKKVTWTTLFPAKSKSDIALKWGILPIPKIFVIDREGVIRHVDLKGEELAGAVEKLIAK